MGQEIVHCSVCGTRLRSVDFERGGALRVDHSAYCQGCKPEEVSPPAGPSPSTRRKKKNSTTRISIVTPRRALEAVPEGPSRAPLLIGGAGALAVALLAGLWVAGSRTRPEQPVRVEIPREISLAPAPPVDRPSAPAVIPPPTPAPRAAPTGPVTPESISQELAHLDLRVTDLARQEKFRDAFDLLTSSRTAYDSLEWTAGLQRRLHDLEARVKELRAALEAKMDAARARGDEAGMKAISEQIARWGLPEPDRTPAPAAPAPAPAPPAAAPAPPAAPPAVPPPAPAAAPAPTAGLVPFTAGLAKWTLLVPTQMSATGGATLTGLEDGSILAAGANPAQTRYELRVSTDLRGITAFRLELLPDAALPAQGPGRAFNGNLVLTEFQVQLLADPHAPSGAVLPIDRSMSDHSQDNFPVAHAHDGRGETGWAILPEVGRAHEAVFELRSPLGGPGPATLLIVLDHQSVHAQHTLGRFRLSATASKTPTQDLQNRPPPVIDPARVREAIERGVAWLRKAPYPDTYPWCANELILWTFVHAGVPESDPEFQRRLKTMLDGPLDRTYRVALQAMILEELDRVTYQPRLWQCAQFLTDNQCLNGQWSYGTPVEPAKAAPPAGKPVATSGKLDPDGRRVRPRVVRKMVVRKTRDGPPEGDNSNSQYAALGLRACFDAGILFPDETVLRAIKWWVEGQYFDEHKEGDYAARGWSYTSAAKEARATNSMTAGGISSLTIYDYMLGRDWKRNQPLKQGVNWIAQFFGAGSYSYYYLYGLERAGVLYGLDKFGRHAWYPLGAKWILDHQDPSGGWITHTLDPLKPDELVWNTYDTCFAILFLRRATRPLVASEDARSR